MVKLLFPYFNFILSNFWRMLGKIFSSSAFTFWEKVYEEKHKLVSSKNKEKYQKYAETFQFKVIANTS